MQTAPHEAEGAIGDADAPDAVATLCADLNAAQYAAVTHGDGPLLVVAGAGTGKTTTLPSR
jgi:DNA helicase-2/ATP-dependent DNA helicase PcrA